MKQFFRNKFFYIISAVALVLVIVPVVFAKMGLTPLVRKAVGVMLTPVQKVFNYAADAVDGYVSYFYKFDELAEENRLLREKVSELESQVYDAEDLKKMYTWMSGFLEMKIKHTDFKFLEASVTGREGGNYSKLLVLDVGTTSGVHVNMPVVTSSGVVGRVVEVGLTWAKVAPVSAPSSSVGVYVERTNDEGVCSGDLELMNTGFCYLKHLPQDSSVAVGDIVLSSGLGGVYPRDLAVGVVESVEKNAYTSTLDVRVKTAVDDASLTDVMIIISFDSYAAMLSVE